MTNTSVIMTFKFNHDLSKKLSIGPWGLLSFSHQQRLEECFSTLAAHQNLLREVFVNTKCLGPTLRDVDGSARNGALA